MVPLFWRVLNLIVIVMKGDLERSWLYLMMNPLLWKRFQLTMIKKVAIYDYYCDDMYAIKRNDIQETWNHDFNAQIDYVDQVSCDSYFVEFASTTIDQNKFAYVKSNNFFMHVDHEKNTLCDSYIVEFIHDATENYYDRGTYASTYHNNIKFPLFMLKVLKLRLFCLLC